MYDDELKGMQRVKYWLYRALGKSDTQARWQLRQNNNKDQSSKRINRHKNCAQCGQLLLLEDKLCQRCGTTQYAPSWLLQVSRKFNVEAESIIPILVGLCVFGYLVQISLGCSFFGGLDVEWSIRLRVVTVGAGLPISLSEYLSFDNAWRLFTYTCVHGNLMHIMFNMIALIQIGPLVARTFGLSRTLFFWVASGALAILLPALIFPTGLVVGASGAVFGLIGVAMAYGHKVKTPQGILIRNKMIEWTVFCTLFGFAMGRNIAHGAHFGGLIGGAILSFLLPPPQTDLQRALSPILLLSSVGFIAWSIWSAAQLY